MVEERRNIIRLKQRSSESIRYGDKGGKAFERLDQIIHSSINPRLLGFFYTSVPSAHVHHTEK